MWTSRWTRSGLVLGFALGGFFDGILLHQILQWHHLLSLVPGLEDMRLQVLWDGYFHALMYVIGAFGLWGLWRARRHAGTAQGRVMAGALLIGFGTWHLVDSVLSHWILGIHRIKLDSPNPLLWDLVWFAVFGVVPVVLGWWLARGGRGTSGRPMPVAAALALSAVTLGAGLWAMRPPSDQPFTTVVFRPGMAAAQVEGVLQAMNARLIWADPSMGVVIVDLAPQRRWALYGEGAMLVSGSGVPAGCFAWSAA